VDRTDSRQAYGSVGAMDMRRYMRHSNTVEGNIIRYVCVGQVVKMTEMRAVRACLLQHTACRIDARCEFSDGDSCNWALGRRLGA
jgi:hypothetical protein